MIDWPAQSAYGPHHTLARECEDYRHAQASQCVDGYILDVAYDTADCEDSKRV